MAPLLYEKDILRRFINTWDETLHLLVSRNVIERSLISKLECEIIKDNKLDKEDKNKVGVVNGLLIVSLGCDLIRLLFYLLLYIINPLKIYDSSYKLCKRCLNFNNNKTIIGANLGIKKINYNIKSDNIYRNIFDFNNNIDYDYNYNIPNVFYEDVKIQSVLKVYNRLILVLGYEPNEFTSVANGFVHIINSICKKNNANILDDDNKNNKQIKSSPKQTLILPANSPSNTKSFNIDTQYINDSINFDCADDDDYGDKKHHNNEMKADCNILKPYTYKNNKRRRTRRNTRIKITTKQTLITNQSPIESTIQSTVGVADVSSNYLPVNGIATPRDRGEDSSDVTSGRIPGSDLRELEGDVNREGCLQDNVGISDGNVTDGNLRWNDISSELSNDNLPIMPDVLLPRIEFLDGKNLSIDREKLYVMGGIFCLPSRILIADILTTKIIPELISGIIILNAHKIIDDYNIPFVLKLIRSKNRIAFIKCITDSLQSITYNNKLNFILRSIFTNNFFIYPRYHINLENLLNNHSIQPLTYEVLLELTSLTKEIYFSIIKLLRKLLDDLHRNDNNFQCLDMNKIIYAQSIKKLLKNIFEKSFFPNNPNYIKRSCESIINLKLLLEKLLDMDPINFLEYLDQLKLNDPEAHWIFTPDGEIISKLATSRYITNRHKESSD